MLTTADSTDRLPNLRSILERVDRLLLPVSIVALVAGALAIVAADSSLGNGLWIALTIIVGARLLVEIIDA
ncbi:MAG: hypothetical protein ACRDGQ_00040, partial [Candidatus Limnocylindrales bacterium]